MICYQFGYSKTCTNFRCLAFRRCRKRHTRSSVAAELSTEELALKTATSTATLFLRSCSLHSSSINLIWIHGSAFLFSSFKMILHWAVYGDAMTTTATTSVQERLLLSAILLNWFDLPSTSLNATLYLQRIASTRYQQSYQRKTCQIQPRFTAHTTIRLFQGWRVTPCTEKCSLSPGSIGRRTLTMLAFRQVITSRRRYALCLKVKVENCYSKNSAPRLTRFSRLKDRSQTLTSGSPIDERSQSTGVRMATFIAGYSSRTTWALSLTSFSADYF